MEPKNCPHKNFEASVRIVDCYGQTNDEGFFDGIMVICDDCKVDLRHYTQHEVVSLIHQRFNNEDIYNPVQATNIDSAA